MLCSDGGARTAGGVAGRLPAAAGRLGARGTTAELVLDACVLSADGAKAFARHATAVCDSANAESARAARLRQNCSRRARTGFCGSREGPLDSSNSRKAAGGKRVVVTRAPEQAQDLVRALEKLGAEVLMLPTVSFAPPEDSSALDAAMRATRRTSTGFFSPARMRYDFSRSVAVSLKLDPSRGKVAKPQIAAVGPATAQAATEAGFRVDYRGGRIRPANRSSRNWSSKYAVRSAQQRAAAAQRSRGRSLAASPARSGRAGDGSGCVSHGCGPNRSIRKCWIALRQAEVDAIVFRQPFGISQLGRCRAAGGTLAELSERVQFAAIGPTTARALREAGCAWRSKRTKRRRRAWRTRSRNIIQRQTISD